MTGVNLDSLVDIVSNIVGALVLLAAFMALFGLINRPAEDSARNPALLQPEKVLVPWSHPTNKVPVLFVIQGNRILSLDLREFYKNLSKLPPTKKPEQSKFRQEGYTINFFPVTNQTYCMVFEPEEGQGETWLQGNRPGSRWAGVLAQYPSESFYYFFWVRDDSFELFRNVRQSLWESNYEVGWKPMNKDSSLEICNGFEGATGFQPQ